MAEPPRTQAERVYLFGPFRLLPARQLLLEGEAPVRIGGRAFDVLTALVEQAGSVVTKNELMARAWPRVVVEDSNLKVTVAALRRALGEGRPGHRYLANVPGRGYRFVAPVQCTDVSTAPDRAQPLWHNLPHRSTRMVGRAEVVASLARTLTERRLVSIVGPGGIGKTTVALAVAEMFIDKGEHEVGFVNLASLPDARLVPAAVAKALQVTISENTASALAMALRDRRLLIVLDSCEHVLETTAALVDEILAAAPRAQVLATTREILRARGEAVHRLAPLSAPPHTDKLTASEAQAFPAVELFVERASACREGFNLSDADAPVVADICRRLEGIALAIELAATRVDSFTLRELSALLENKFRLLKLDQRSALTRHRSLAAALDWSHELLAENQRAVLRRLSVFSGPFTLASAFAITDDGNGDVVAALEGLVAKSLVSADVGGTVVHYRLLDTTRAYAAQKLLDSGEWIDSRRRHAQHHLEVLTRAEQESTQLQSAEWLADHGRSIDDVRSALTWAFSADGDRELAIALTIAAIPLWTQLSLLDECRMNVALALDLDVPGRPLPRSDRMKLLAALGVALLYTRGPEPETEALWKEALALAEQVNDLHYQLRMLWALPVYLVYFGDYRAALGYLRRLRIVARKYGDSADRVSTERLIATTLHYFGRQRHARQRLERALQAYAAPAQQSHILRFQFDQRATARGTLASILWLQGYATQAAQTAREAVEDARTADHPVSLCSALGLSAFPIALYIGDLSEAERCLKHLLDHSARHSLAVWCSLGDCLEGMLTIERGELAGVDRMQDALERLWAARFCLRRSYFLGALARGQARAGRLSDALATIEDALALCEQTGERWNQPEILRLKGECVRTRGSSGDLHEAEQLYKQSINLSRRQGSHIWELRSTTSLAELCMDLGRHGEASEALVSVYSRFTEGFETPDLQKAARLIAELQHTRGSPRAGRHLQVARRGSVR